MGHRGDDVLLSLFRGADVLLHGELAAGREAAADAAAVDDVVRHLVFFHADADQGLALGLLRVFARVVENLPALVAGQIDDRRGIVLQIGFRRLEVVVGVGPLAGPIFELMLPIGDHVEVADHVAAEGDFFFLAIDVGADVVAQHQGVLAVLVLEEVENAVLLHQAGDEIEGRFPVLHAVLALGIGLRGRELVVADAELAEDLLQDRGDVLVLENAAIGRAGEQPQRGHDLGAIRAVRDRRCPRRQNATTMPLKNRSPPSGYFSLTVTLFPTIDLGSMAGSSETIFSPK